VPNEGGDPGADVQPRQPDSGASFSAGAGGIQGLRDRCLTDGLASAKALGENRPASSLDPFGVAEALAAWFGPSLDVVGRDRTGLLRALDRDIAGLDELLSDQISAILHAPAFQRLEAAWRGLRYVTQAADGIAGAKIRVLSLSWNELVRDLERAADFDQSQLFHKIYSEEFGSPGGEPFGLVIADYAMQHHRTPDHPTDDVTALKALSAVAGAAFVPIVLGVSPIVFQLDSFRDLGRPVDLQSVFKQAEYKRWNSMREGDDMRFIGLVLPRILMRLPYGDDTTRHDGFCFREAVHASGEEGYLWGNAAFAFASIVLRAFGTFGWFADIRGAPRDELRGGLVIDLPVPWFGTDRPRIAVKPSTECFISDMHEKSLAELGFIALKKVPLTEFSVFNEIQSMQIPARFDRPSATANARLSGMLQYTLCISRFAHFIKVIGREHIGSLMTAEECQDLLQRWLTGYCVGSDSATAEIKARYPLRDGSVEVKDVPGKPGFYSCNIFLQPHFQLDDIAAGFRLVTELAPTARV
jgi:type VI secretion system protein ImpD